MTTRVTIKNENQGAPYADWDVEVSYEGHVQHTLKPGEQHDFHLWHDGRSLTVREKPKAP
jgi:hypothetical protein